MKLTICGLTDAVTISATPFPGGDQSENNLRLVPSGNEVISIELMNSPMELIRKGSHHMRSGRHFEMFWQLVDQPNVRGIPKLAGGGATERSENSEICQRAPTCFAQRSDHEAG